MATDHTGILDGTLKQYFRVLFWPPRAARRSPRTLALYEVDLSHFDRFCGRAATLDDLTDEKLEAYLAARLAKPVAPATANRSRDVLVALWRFLASKGIIDRWPTNLPLVEPRRIPIAWTRGQLVQLWAACESQQGAICGIPAGLWWHCLHSILWDSGERIGSVLQLRWDDVDMASRWVVFRAATRKGRREDNAQQLHPDTVTLLAKMPRKSPLVLPWPTTKQMLWHHYRRIRRDAGLPEGRRHAFHCVRRSVASYVELAGGNATAVLGHASPRTTRAYIDPRLCPPQQASQILFRPHSPDGDAA